MRKYLTFINSRIQLKIILPFAALTLALAIIGTYLSTSLVADSLDQRFESQLKDSTSVAAEVISQREQFHLTEIRSIAFTEGVNTAIAEGDRQLLQQLLFPIVANNGIDRVDVVRQDGSVLLTIRREPGTSTVEDYTVSGEGDLANLSVVQKVLNGVVDDIGDKHVELTSIAKDRLFITAGPAKQGEEVVGAILVSTHLRNMLRLLKQATFAEVSLNSLDGQLLMTTVPGGIQTPLPLALTPQEASVLLGLDGNTSLRRSIKLDNREYDILPSIFIARGSPQGFYSVAIQTAAIVSRGNTTRNWMALIFILALGSVFVIGYTTSNMITGRVKYLMENAMAVAGGDFSRRTDISSEDEIGSLARSLDHMTASLADYTTALQHKIDELTALYESSTAVTVRSGLNLAHVLQAITSSISSVMQEADQIVVYLLDDQKMLHPIVSAPPGINGFPSYFLEDNSRIEAILTSAKPQTVQLSDIAEYSFNGHGFSNSGVNGFTNLLITPLVAGQETIGMLTLTIKPNSSTSLAIPLDDNNERLLGTFANQAAIAIKNAQLFEATQHAYEELRQLDQLKTEFINIAAHELRTPLGAILGHASSAEKRAPPKLKKYISFIVISALRMRTMIDAMLTIQRLDAGTAFLKVLPVDIGKVLGKIVADYQPMAELEGHIITLSVLPDLPSIEVDAEKVGLVFSNLIANAIKFTPEGGHIEISAQDYGDSILVTIHDDGVGITPENQQQIFERFYQVRTEEMIKYGTLGVGAGHGGMGIGLTIVKHLVELHQGEVWVESEPGKGSTFFVTLPKTIPTASHPSTILTSATEPH
jgi:signal transduction histidine kinase/HAMP domain-containing protein